MAGIVCRVLQNRGQGRGRKIRGSFRGFLGLRDQRCSFAVDRDRR